MGLFRPYEQGKGHSDEEARPSRRGSTGATEASVARAAQQVQPQAETAEVRAGQNRQPQKKGTRTPTRAEAEAARMARLHPVLSPKEQKKANREADRERRMSALAAVERTPARQLARDTVDSRLTITEFTIPLMVATMVVTFVFATNRTVQNLTSIVMLALLVLWFLNIMLMRRTLRMEGQARGIDTRQRGLTMYMVNRMMTLRSLRRPAPRVKRGEKF